MKKSKVMLYAFMAAILIGLLPCLVFAEDDEEHYKKETEAIDAVSLSNLIDEGYTAEFAISLSEDEKQHIFKTHWKLYWTEFGKTIKNLKQRGIFAKKHFIDAAKGVGVGVALVFIACMAITMATSSHITGETWNAEGTVKTIHIQEDEPADTSGAFLRISTLILIGCAIYLLALPYLSDAYLFKYLFGISNTWSWIWRTVVYGLLRFIMTFIIVGIAVYIFFIALFIVFLPFGILIKKIKKSIFKEDSSATDTILAMLSAFLEFLPVKLAIGVFIAVFLIASNYLPLFMYLTAVGVNV